MKKILIAVDGSSESKKAAAEALAIANKNGSSVTFLSVVPSAFEPLVEAGLMDEKYAALPDNAMTESTEKMMANLLECMHPGDVAVDRMIVTGVAPLEILRAAQEGNYDLIAMGHRSMDVFRKKTPGPVARRVIEDALCSVMIVR